MALDVDSGHMQIGEKARASLAAKAQRFSGLPIEQEARSYQKNRGKGFMCKCRREIKEFRHIDFAVVILLWFRRTSKRCMRVISSLCMMSKVAVRPVLSGLIWAVLESICSIVACHSRFARQVQGRGISWCQGKAARSHTRHVAERGFARPEMSCRCRCSVIFRV